jgi:hypothetical protein
MQSLRQKIPGIYADHKRIDMAQPEQVGRDNHRDEANQQHHPGQKGSLPVRHRSNLELPGGRKQAAKHQD